MASGASQRAGGTPTLGIQAAAIGATAAVRGKSAATAGQEVGKAVRRAGGSPLQAARSAGLAAGVIAAGNASTVATIPGLVSAAVSSAVLGLGGDSAMAMELSGSATTQVLLGRGLANTTLIVGAALAAADLAGNSTHVRAQVAGAAVAAKLGEGNSTAEETARQSAAAVLASGGTADDAAEAAGLAAGAAVIAAGGDAASAADSAKAAAAAAGGSATAVEAAGTAAGSLAAVCSDAEYQTERRLGDGTSGASCEQCTPGYFCREDIRIPCARGTFSNRSTGNACVPCRNGTIALADAQHTCQACVAPRIFSSADHTFCSDRQNATAATAGGPEKLRQQRDSTQPDELGGSIDLGVISGAIVGTIALGAVVYKGYKSQGRSGYDSIVDDAADDATSDAAETDLLPADTAGAAVDG